MKPNRNPLKASDIQLDDLKNDTDRIQNFMNNGYKTRNLLQIHLKNTDPSYMRHINDPKLLQEMHDKELESTRRKTFRRTILTSRKNSGVFNQSVALIESPSSNINKNKSSFLNKKCISELLCSYPENHVNLLSRDMISTIK